MPAFAVKDLLAEELHLHLSLLTQNANLDLQITENDLNRPGLALTGFFDYFANERIQLFGQGEWSYLQTMSPNVLDENLNKFFSYSLCCLIFTHNNSPPDSLLTRAEQKSIPVLRTDLNTHKFILRISHYLDEKLARSTILHGVLIEVFGVGVLLQGKSGVGKSETALELVERGHRLVADDIVEITCRDENRLYGSVSETIEHHMEIRGLGIISVKDLFGAGSVRKNKRIDLIIHLEDWDQEKEYDRLGLDEQKQEILGVEVDIMTIPVRPGRNLPILIETAAKNHSLKVMGHNAARLFNEKLRKLVATGSDS